jgi:DNA polymerase III alpha subunit (gram-positive type)
MKYIVLDLEWNQPLSPQRMVREPFNLGGEIIQIGAVKIDSLEGLNITERYSEIVKPVYYTKMNKHVTEVTELTDDDLAQGRPFTEVCAEFLD